MCSWPLGCSFGERQRDDQILSKEVRWRAREIHPCVDGAGPYLLGPRTLPHGGEAILPVLRILLGTRSMALFVIRCWWSYLNTCYRCGSSMWRMCSLCKRRSLRMLFGTTTQSWRGFWTLCWMWRQSCWVSVFVLPVRAVVLNNACMRMQRIYVWVTSWRLKTKRRKSSCEGLRRRRKDKASRIPRNNAFICALSI